MNKRVIVFLSIWVALIFMSIGAVSYMSYRYSQELYDSVYYYEVINAPTRSIQALPITEDTLFLKRLEDSTKELKKGY